MKCRIYLQDDVMNHITDPVNQHIKMDKWFHKVMHLRIWGGETRTHSDISHIRKKKIAMWRSTQELSLMIGSLKTSTFFYHRGLEFHLGLRRHLAVTGNSASSRPPPTSSCKHSSILTHASPALGRLLLLRGRQGVTVMSDNWTELPGPPATLVSGLWVCFFF